MRKVAYLAKTKSHRFDAARRAGAPAAHFSKKGTPGRTGLSDRWRYRLGAKLRIRHRWLRALSKAVGYAADNALLGATVGGNLPGGLVGHVLRDSEPDNDRSRIDPPQPTTISE